MRRKSSDQWRQLSQDQLREALLQLGLDATMAEEYLDDPNAMPSALKKRLNEYVDARNP